MREEQQVRGDDEARHPAAAGAGTLVVLTPERGQVARTSNWIRGVVEGQELIAIPRLHVEHEAALAIVAGRGLGEVFLEARIQTPEWEDIAGFVGGSWQLWKTSRPELTVVGFVRGMHKFDIERAVRGLKKLFEET